MNILALTLGLSAIVFYALYAIHYNRAANLEIQNCDLRDQLADAYALLDDATRNTVYWQERTDALLCETSTLLVDLTHTECRNAYLESLHLARKGETAGIVLTSFVVNPRRKMQVGERVAP